jgi:predicted  nucleic acid-binding Zn-ribbon protein
LKQERDDRYQEYEHVIASEQSTSEGLRDRIAKLERQVREGKRTIELTMEERVQLRDSFADYRMEAERKIDKKLQQSLDMKDSLDKAIDDKEQVERELNAVRLEMRNFKEMTRLKERSILPT